MTGSSFSTRPAIAAANDSEMVRALCEEPKRPVNKLATDDLVYGACAM